MYTLKLKFSTLEKKKGIFKKLASFKKKNRVAQDLSHISEFECNLYSNESGYFFVLNSQLTPIKSGDSIQNEDFHIQFEIEEAPSVKSYDHILLKDSLEPFSKHTSDFSQENDPLAFLYENFNFKTASLAFPVTRLLSNQEEETSNKPNKNKLKETLKPPNKWIRRKIPSH